VLLLFEAIKTVWDSSGIVASFPGGIHASGTVPADARRPYVVALPLTDSPRLKTNKGRYPDLHLQFEVLADEFESGTALAYQWRDVLLAGRLILPPATLPGESSERLVVLLEGPITWQEEDLFWRILVEFTGKVARPAIAPQPLS
jgi:hypothetical protein